MEIYCDLLTKPSRGVIVKRNERSCKTPRDSFGRCQDERGCAASKGSRSETWSPPPATEAAAAGGMPFVASGGQASAPGGGQPNAGRLGNFVSFSGSAGLMCEFFNKALCEDSRP